MTFLDSSTYNESSRAQVSGEGGGVLRQWRTATLRFRWRRVVGAKLHTENYSGVLQIENCCAVGKENDSGSI